MNHTTNDDFDINSETSDLLNTLDSTANKMELMDVPLTLEEFNELSSKEKYKIRQSLVKEYSEKLCFLSTDELINLCDELAEDVALLSGKRVATHLTEKQQVQLFDTHKQANDIYTQSENDSKIRNDIAYEHNVYDYFKCLSDFTGRLANDYLFAAKAQLKLRAKTASDTKMLKSFNKTIKKYIPFQLR